ncbi:MAG: substrate-binding domain-containing protein [Planctomycetia bacterium]|nr:substrate-binding domain-containing protein [Planctomycetia bacterium]
MPLHPRLLLSVLLLVPSLAGCGQATDHGNSDPSKPRASGNTSNPKVARSERVIGVSLLTLENPFFKVIGDTIAAEGEKRGYQVIVLSADKDPAKQANQLDDFIVRNVSAIVLSPCESRAMVPSIQKANTAGIPVFTVDIPCHEKGVKIVSQIATDNLGGGREAAQAMIEVLGKTGGKIAILHFPQAESCLLRVQGFREIINKHNAGDGGKIEIVGELDGGGSKDQGFKAAQDILEAHGTLRGIFAINDPSALGARAAVEKAGKADQITIIGFDGQPEGKQAIKEGKIYADPIQFPEQMGVKVVEAIVQHSKGEDVPPSIPIPTRLYRKADAEQDPSLGQGPLR